MLICFFSFIILNSSLMRRFEDPYVSCPFEKSHNMPKQRLQWHLVKCPARLARVASGLPIYYCKFHAMHVFFNQAEVEYHEIHDCQAEQALKARKDQEFKLQAERETEILKKQAEEVFKKVNFENCIFLKAEATHSLAMYAKVKSKKQKKLKELEELRYFMGGSEKDERQKGSRASFHEELPKVSFFEAISRMSTQQSESKKKAEVELESHPVSKRLREA